MESLSVAPSADSTLEKEFTQAFVLNLKDAIRSLSVGGITYREIAERAGVSESFIKQFIFRKSKQPRRTVSIRRLADAVSELATANNLESSIAFAHDKNSGIASSRRLFLQKVSRPTAVSKLLELYDDKANTESLSFLSFRGRFDETSILTKYETVIHASKDLTSCLFVEYDSGERYVRRRGAANTLGNTLTLEALSPDGISYYWSHLRILARSKLLYGTETAFIRDEIETNKIFLVPSYLIDDNRLGVVNKRHFIDIYRQEVMFFINKSGSESNEEVDSRIILEDFLLISMSR